MTQAKPSKSERKRRQLELQKLGEQLIMLSDDLLDTLPLGERLRTAIDDVRRMKAHEALRRQKQYIGKLMREVDPEPVAALLDKLRAADRRDKRVFANAERWRDRLIRNEYGARQAFAAECDVDAEALDEVLDALNHASSDRVERENRRKLFRLVHSALAASTMDG